MLQVDGKPVAFTGEKKRIFMDAGTHLVELKVGQSLMSREVRVSTLGVSPKEIIFKPEDLATAIVVTPPAAAVTAAAETTVAKTDPTVTKEDRQKDDKLMALLPKPEEIDRQLREARDQQVVAVFEAGLRSLRLGYARGNRSYLSIAANRFAEATRLAPEMALGYFNLGLAKFYLDQMGDAQVAFQQAVALDRSLDEDVPLLWWEDFDRSPCRTTIHSPDRPNNSGAVKNGLYSYRGTTSEGLLFYDLERPYTVGDAVVRFRFRILASYQDDPEAGLGSSQRMSRTPKGKVTCWINSDGRKCHLAAIPEGNLRHWYPIAANQGIHIDNGWHVAEHVVHGLFQALYIDGRLMCEGRDDRSQDWSGQCGLSVSGHVSVDIDWVLVTRY